MMTPGQAGSDVERVPVPWRIYGAIFLITVPIIMALLYLVQQSRDISATHDPLLLPILEIKLDVTSAHLWLEEILGGDSTENIETVRQFLAGARVRLHALVVKIPQLEDDETSGAAHDEKAEPDSGRESGSEESAGHGDGHASPAVSEAYEEYGRLHLFHERHTIYAVREPLRAAEKSLGEFQEILEQRYAAGKTSGPGTELDSRLDEVFGQFLKSLGDAEGQIRSSKATHLAEFEAIKNVLIAVCLLLAVLIAAVLHRFERRRAGDMVRIRQAKKEVENLVAEIEDAATQIRTLRGVVPICAGCKKVRDDKGFWQQVEVYVREHTEAQFSHGLCPECIKEDYPDYAEEVASDDGP